MAKKKKGQELLGYDAVENWDTPNAGCARPGNGTPKKKKQMESEEKKRKEYEKIN
jgi:hypothetical protein